MPKLGKGLTDRQVRTLPPGVYCDRDSLYLQVSPSRTRSWFVRYISPTTGRRRDMGLGPLRLVSLAEARDRARTALKAVRELIDPLEARQAAKAAVRVDAARAITFKAAAEKYIAAQQAGWRNEKHAAQWAATLATYAYPALGELPVASIDTTLVLKVLEPIWSTKPETASRLRGRIEAVLDWAGGRGYRKGENPARWRGHLQKQLPPRARVRRVEHHPALAYAKIGEFMAALRVVDGISARALEFTILTAGRTGEVLGAQWDEIDLDMKVWTVPAGRMKSGKPHRVPLSARAVAIIEQLAEVRSDNFVFPGGRGGRPLSGMALLMLLRRMGRGDITTHGFRSTFKEWAAERTNFANEVSEMALAHAVSDKVEAAYRRGDLFEKRRRIMDDWATFCESSRDLLSPGLYGIFAGL
jgi:integrase